MLTDTKYRIYVRCVRGGVAKPQAKGPAVKSTGKRLPPSPDGGGGAVDRFIKRLDKNGDGKVSKREFDEPDHHFDRLDRNSDGYLEANEAPSGPPRRPRGRPGRT